jgi:hypothetical protein
MNSSMTLALLGALGLTGCGSSVGLAQESRNPSAVLVPFEEIAFHRPIPIVAPEMAALWGDRSLGASGNEEKQPAGKAISARCEGPEACRTLVFQPGPATPAGGR